MKHKGYTFWELWLVKWGTKALSCSHLTFSPCFHIFLHLLESSKTRKPSLTKFIKYTKRENKESMK